MSKKILAFGASSSIHSINKQLATFAAQQVKNATVTLLDLNNFEMPIYSVDKEQQLGIPKEAQLFKQHVRETDGIIISFAEHNGAYSAAFKNIYDWMSRIGMPAWENKPMLLLSTSPGGRGGLGVLTLAYDSFSFGNKKVSGKFALPAFQNNFSATEGILDESLKAEFEKELAKFEGILNA
ncbi:MAG: NAD(P)H-dependent oxidoreductase [Saprospiraceae bacterium]|nr:NAD(P)H-dependent oxidoreductase [Saprospiraceae bacterium]